MDASIFDRLAHRPARIEAALRDALARGTAVTPPRLAEAMAYSLFSQGKRLRPILAVLASEAAGGTMEQALPAACAVEMIHTYSLIHDDLPAMDDDDLRRGLPTCHKQFDEATAILAGDALLTLAFEQFACTTSEVGFEISEVVGKRHPTHTSEVPKPTSEVWHGCTPLVAAVSTLELARAAGCGGMVGGQMLDMLAEGGDGTTVETIHRKKTGALIKASLRLGVLAATHGDTTGTVLRIINTYADAFGLAFQITDDLLDVTGTTEKTGKQVGKDTEKGKLTYPAAMGVAASRRAVEKLGGVAVAAAKSLGSHGELLAALADYVVHRDR